MSAPDIRPSWFDAAISCIRSNAADNLWDIFELRLNERTEADNKWLDILYRTSARFNSRNCMRVIEQYGVSPAAFKSAASAAATEGNLFCLRRIPKEHLSADLYLKAARKGHSDVVEYLLQRRVPLDQEDLAALAREGSHHAQPRKVRQAAQAARGD